MNYFYVQLYFFYHTIVVMDLFLGFNLYIIVFVFLGCEPFDIFLLAVYCFYILRSDIFFTIHL